MASDNPIDLRALPNGAARRRSQGRRSFSRPSSAAQVPSSRNSTLGRDASEHAEGSKRGKKPFEFTEEVDHGILRLYNATDVPLDTMATAVKGAGGPRKLWLRKRLTQITGTRCMDMFRLDKESAAKRRERQHAAMGLDSRPSNHTRQERMSTEATASNSRGWTARLEAAAAEETSVAHDRPPSLREQAVIWKPRRPSAYSIGPENDSKQPSARRPSLARLSTGSKSLVSRTPTAPTPSKRRWTDAIDEETETSYGARREQTRRLSLPGIIQGLENLTGNNGLFHHINRISVQSHLSPRMPSSRFSWMSKTRSITGGDEYSPASPTSNFGGPIPYRPDPDYESFYHEPRTDYISRLRSEGLVAMATLMEAKAALMTDEQAEAHLLSALEQNTELATSHTDADERGVTALHIAAAYGYPRACRYLMGAGPGPFPSIYTKRGSSVCRFARPAQDFVKNDNSLYHRILYCRQWICVGRKPPVAEETPVSARSEEPGSNPFAVPRIMSVDSGILPTLPEIPNDTPEDGQWGMPPLSPASTRPHSILAPLNTDTNTFQIRGSMLEVPLEQEIFSHNGSPISVRICREDHNSLLTPNSFSPDVVFWPDGSGPAFPIPRSLSISNQPTSDPVSIPSNATQYRHSEGLNILSQTNANGHPTPSTSLSTQYDQNEMFGAVMTSALGGPNSYEWAAANQYQLPVAQTSYDSSNYEYTSNPFVSDGQAPGFGYQPLAQTGTSRPHYPTPPADPRQTPQSGWWQPNGDLITATSLALEQSHFPNMLWSSPVWEPPSRNDSMFQPDSRNSFHRQYGRLSDDQMFYEG